MLRYVGRYRREEVVCAEDLEVAFVPRMHRGFVEHGLCFRNVADRFQREVRLDYVPRELLELPDTGFFRLVKFDAPVRVRAQWNEKQQRRTSRRLG